MKEKGLLRAAAAALACLLIASASVSAQGVDDNKKIVELADRGQKMLDSGDCDGALEAFNRVIAMLDTLGEAYTNRGLARACKKDHDGAIRDFDTAIGLIQKAMKYGTPGDESTLNLGDTFYDRGISYEAKGDVEQALKDYSRAVELNPRQVHAFKALAVIYFNRGDHEAAITNLTRAIALDPADVKLYERRSISYSARGDYSSALKDMNKLVELNPKSPAYYRGRALLNRALGNTTQAEADERTAVQLAKP